jgi:DNA-binding NtrC family response regulator
MTDGVMRDSESTTEGCRILLVEDDSAGAEALNLLLRRRGHEVILARTLAQARAELRDPLPDWVVLDLLLPDGNGVQLLETIHDQSLPVRVAIITGVSDPIRLWEATRLHPDAFMRKPVDPYSLVKAIEFES